MPDQIDTAAMQSPNPSGTPTVNGLLGDLMQRDPKLAWLMQMMAAGKPVAPVAVAATEEARQEVETLADHLQQSEARAAKLQRIARRLQSELEEAQERLSEIASAFGACGLCFGQDPGCRSCRGRGKLGMFAPDPELRHRYVAEAISPRPPAAAFVQPGPSFRPQP